MTLRPRIATNVAMLIGGAFFVFIGFGSAILIGLWAGLVPAVLGVLGLLWIAVPILALSRRSSLAITIDEAGISLPAGNLLQIRPAVHIPRDVIASISQHESLKGRLVQITLTSGEKLPVQARHYCEIKTFLSHCKACGLPVV
jgi:hypothetical protein